MNLQSVAAQFQAALLKRDQTAANALIRAYGIAWRSIKEELSVLLKRIEAARARGENVSSAWLLQQNRLQILLRETEQEIGKFAKFASERVKKEQAVVINAAREAAIELMDTAIPSGLNIVFARLPKDALSQLVGTLGDDSPLSRVFGQFGRIARNQITRELINGLALGRSVEGIARNIRDTLGGDLSRALTISRTEVLRAYRSASLETYRANDNVLDGWYWHASLSSRTCAMCLAMHGSFHPLTEDFASHPRCRCTMLPATVPLRSLGLAGSQQQVQFEDAEQWFTRQPEAVQIRMLGQAGYGAFRAGAVRLSDFIGVKSSSQWGLGRYTRSLREILGTRAERFKKVA